MRATIDNYIHDLKSPIHSVRIAAADGLGKMGAAAATAAPQIVVLLRIPNKASHPQGPGRGGGLPGGPTNQEGGIRYDAGYAPGQLGKNARAVVPDIIQLLGDKHAEIRDAAVMALGRIGPAASSALPRIIDLFKDKDYGVRSRAVTVVGKFGLDVAPIVPRLVTLMKDNDEDVRRRAGGALGRIGPSFASLSVPALTGADGRRKRCSLFSIRSLGEIGFPAASSVPNLTLVLEDKNTGLRDAAVVALSQIAMETQKNVPLLGNVELSKQTSYWEKVLEKLTRIDSNATVDPVGYEKSKTTIQDLLTILHTKK